MEIALSIIALLLMVGIVIVLSIYVALRWAAQDLTNEVRRQMERHNYSRDAADAFGYGLQEQKARDKRVDLLVRLPEDYVVEIKHSNE